MPEAWDSLRARVNNFEMLRGALDDTAQPIEWFARGTHVFSVVSSTFGGIFNLFVVIFVGIYAAASPRRYLSLGRDLMSRESRDKLGVVARELAHELRLWLLGRGLSMAIVGIATGIGLFVMDVEDIVAGVQDDDDEKKEEEVAADAGGGAGWRVSRATQRFTHARAYIAAEADRAGFAVERASSFTDIVESGVPVASTLFLLRRRGMEVDD